MQCLKNGVPIKIDDDTWLYANGSEWLVFMFDQLFNPMKPFDGFLRGIIIVKASKICLTLIHFTHNASKIDLGCYLHWPTAGAKF